MSFIKLKLVIGHILLGLFLLLRMAPLNKALILFIFILALFHIYKTHNKNEAAILWSFYFVGIEVLLRMSNALILHEFSKYAVLIFLVFGMIIGRKKRPLALIYVFYILLLLVGIAFSDIPYPESIRRAVAFNLSGPILLGISALYFYNRKIQLNIIYKSLFIGLLPIISMLVYIALKAPSIKDTVFNTQANFAASGGYGPNQVATILGFGLFIIFLFILTNKKIVGNRYLDASLFIYLLYRTLLTFSRGGLLTAIIAMGAFLGFFILVNLHNKMKLLKIAGFIFLAFSVIFMYTSIQTGGMLEKRYVGKNSNGSIKEDITAGRTEIFKTDLVFFFENPIFGIGVGSGKYRRIESQKFVTAASHNEVSRLIGEHGIIGVILLLIIFMIPLIKIYNEPNYMFKALLLSFFVFWFLTINHSAMRVAFPGFIYGLSLIRITTDEKNSIHRK